MRALLLIIDGLGVGDAPDAGNFHPTGANTLGNLLSASPNLSLPVLTEMGLIEALEGRIYDPPARSTSACYGRMRPQAPGNDSTSGHWELAGALLQEPFPTYSTFPSELVSAIENEAGITFLGNERLSMPEALRRYGKVHLQTGQPILFTSASSVFQIAGHDKALPLPRLYELAKIARRHADTFRIGRVIARPFTGASGKWNETPGRYDFSIPPPRTVLNIVADAGLPVIGVGKIGDLFAMSGITRSHRAGSDQEVLNRVSRLWEEVQEGLIVANLSDCDTLHGHRRDPVGFGRSLEAVDRWLGTLLATIDEDDLVIVTSDHGNDPTFPGTDHSREEVPVLARYDGRVGPLGLRESLVDVAATLVDFFHPRVPDSASLPGTPLLTFHRPPPGW